MNLLNDNDLMPTCIRQQNQFVGVSNRYQHFNTLELVETLKDKGWVPFTLSATNTRVTERKGYQKHLIRFRHRDFLNTERSEVPELIIVNSHDGSCSYEVMSGLFRFACSNGLIVADELFQRYKIRHVKNTNEVIRHNREEDKGIDLWTIYNVIQENILNGGLQYSKVNDKGELKIKKTKAIRDIKRIVSINIALWAYAKGIYESYTKKTGGLI